MHCPETTNIHRLLAGTLSATETRSAMDHTRVCPACRSLLLGTSKMLTAPRTKGRSSDVARPLPDLPEASTVPSPYLVDVPRPATSRKSRIRSFFKIGLASRRTLMTIGIMLAVGWSFRGRLVETTNHAPATPKEILIDSAIRDGMPYWEAPVGHMKTRPKVIRVILPRGNDSFEMHVLAAGEAERTITFKNAEDGITFENSSNYGPDGPFPTVETMIPFPDDATFHLDHDKTYFVWAVLPNGCASIPMRITLKAP